MAMITGNNADENLQEAEVLLRHFTIPKLNHALVWALWVDELSTHQHPHLGLQVADDLQSNQSR